MKRTLNLLLAALFILSTFNVLFAGRYYMPEIARWATPDPALQQMYPHQLLKIHNGMLLNTSPYVYTFDNPLKYTDPDGNIPAPVIGALSGAGLDIALQMATNYYQGKSVFDISWKEVGVSAGLGAVGGGLISKGGKLLKLIRLGSKTDDALTVVDDVANLADDAISLSDDAAREGTKKFTQGQLKQFEQQMAKDGIRSLEKSRVSLQKRLDQHLKKLGEIKKNKGQTSSVEREIRNFRQQIEAIDEVLRGAQ